MKDTKKVQLVLGCGGARGIAHIGVIDKLLADGYEIVEVVGCSMGAVVGGLYCSGHLPAYKEWLLKLVKSDLYRLFDFTLSRQGWVKGEKIFSVLQDMTGDVEIEKLPIPFTAVATDMATRTEIHFKTGNLHKALRASTGIPGIFTPIVDDKKLYVDGGVLNPLPLNLVEKRKDTIVVAVNLNGASPEPPAVEIAEKAAEKQPTPEESPDMISRFKKYFSSVAKEDSADKVEELPNLSWYDILSASYDASLDRLAEMMIMVHPPDVLIEIPRNTCTVFEFYRAQELIKVGQSAYDLAMARRDEPRRNNFWDTLLNAFNDSEIKIGGLSDLFSQEKPENGKEA
ncbi:MAG: patatin-like phospholipase family protein [Chitinophagales bacterium]